MDVGLYNKDQKQAFGSHGTLIGNWVEERELRRATGHARTADYWNRWAADDTKARVFSYGADANTTAPSQSVMKATYPAPHAHAYPRGGDKFFHRSRPRYWSDATADKALAATKGTAQAQAQADALAHGLPINSAFKSTVSLGQHTTALTTTYGSTFLPSLSAPASAAHGMGVVKKDWSTPKSEWLQSLHAHRHGPWRDPANAAHLMADNPYVSPYAQSARPNGGTIGGASGASGGNGGNSARLRSPGAAGAAAAAARPQSVPYGAQRVRSPSAAAAGAGAGKVSPVRRAATPAAATRAAAAIKSVSPPPAGLATNVTLDQNA